MIKRLWFLIQTGAALFFSFLFFLSLSLIILKRSLGEVQLYFFVKKVELLCSSGQTNLDALGISKKGVGSSPGLEN